MATITFSIAPMQQTEDFEKAVQAGYEQYEDEIKTPADVWAFLECEISPRALKGDKYAEQIHGVSMPSLSKRVGFIVGYLTRAMTELQEENGFSEKNA